MSAAAKPTMLVTTSFGDPARRLHGDRLARSTVQKQEKLENDGAHHDGDGENQMLEMMRVFVADQLSNALMST